MDKDRKTRIIITLLVFLIVFLLILSAGLYFVNRQENGKTLKKEAYMATVIIKYAVVKAYYMHLNYSHMQGNFSEDDIINMTYDRRDVITMLNFSISTLKDARSRCDSLGWSHMGLDNNIMAYEKLRNFLMENWGNVTKVLPVTKYIMDNWGIAFYNWVDEAETGSNYNYDDSQVIEEGLKHAPP